jgi:glycosyltransferase involved in cell wall biosynthesis
VRSLLLKGYLGLGRFLLSRLILTSNQAVIAITNREAEQLHARASERRKIKIVGEFFSLSDTHALRKNECRDCLGLPQHKKIVCMLGGIEEIKGTVIFLRAATLIASTNANVCFVLAGDDHVSNDRMRAYFDKCMEVAEPLRELGSLIILGHISNSMDLVKASDIIVSPSIISHFSRPVIEAWGFGKPVICSRTDHMQDLIDHRVNGLLFETGDHRQLAQCLSELLADSKFAKKMGVEGKRKVERDFKAEVNTRAIVNECVSLIATHDSV